MMSDSCNGYLSREHSLAMHSKFLAELSQYSPPKSGINVLHHNAHSIFSKMAHYNVLGCLESYDFVSISESWLNDSISSSMLPFPNFKLFRRAREGQFSRGGGALLLVKEHLNVTSLPHLSSLFFSCDSVWVKLLLPGCCPIVVASVYVPPKNIGQFVSELQEALEDEVFNNSDIILCGDFNVNWNNNSKDRMRLMELTDEHNVSQVISGFTYVAPVSTNESLLDLCFVSNRLVCTEARVLVTDLSDHYALTVSISMKKAKPPRKLRVVRNFTACKDRLQQYEEVQTEVVNLVRSLSSPNDQAECLEDWVFGLMNLHAPKQVLRVRPNRPEWLNPSLVRLLSTKNRLYRKVRLLPYGSEWIEYKQFRNYVKRMTDLAKREYYAKKMGESSTAFYKQVNSLLGKSPSSGGVQSLVTKAGNVTDPTDMANVLNEFFSNIPTPVCFPKINSLPVPPGRAIKLLEIEPVDESEVAYELKKLKPDKKGGIHGIPTFVYQSLCATVVPCLTSIINNSILTGSFPTAYKVALVTPVYKKGDPKQPGNYRPISSLPVLSKVFEKILNSRVLAHLGKNDLLCHRQFGFRQYISTEQMLLCLTEQLFAVLDSKQPKYIAHVSLDVRKAFDSVNYCILLEKLSCNFFFSPSTITLFRSYLSDRSQYMKVSGSLSDRLPLTKGVPQGSILGPVLFNLMVNDLIQSYQEMFAYADDCSFYQVASSPESALEMASQMYEEVERWYAANGLSLSAEKTKCIVYSNRHVPQGLVVDLGRAKVAVSSELVLLGFTLDSMLSFDVHIKNVVSSSRRAVCAMRRIQQYFSTTDMRRIYSVMIRPKLEYCTNVFHACLTKCSEQILERCQNFALKVICRVPRVHFSATACRNILGLELLSDRREEAFTRLVQSIEAHRCSQELISLVLNLSRRTTPMTLRGGCEIVLPGPRSTYGKKCVSFRVISAMKGRDR